MGNTINNKTISRKARLELVEVMRPQYQATEWIDKIKILDGLVAVTNYERKYAIRLLNKPIEERKTSPINKQPIPRIYDEQARNALVSIWYSANQICSKRLVHFLSDLIDSLERHGYLRLTREVKKKLLNISPATVDRILQPERLRIGKSPSTTKHGSLIKHQIKVRTFSDWDNVTPGFL